MFISMGMPIPYLSNLPGSSRPGGGGGGGTAIKSIDNTFSMLLDGVDGYFNTSSIDLGVNSSITMWFKPAKNTYALLGEATSGFDYLVSKQSGSFFVWMGGSVSNLMNFGGTITSNIVLDEWNFLAIEKTGDTVIVYIKNKTGEFSNTVTNANVAGLSLKFDRIGARTLATPTLHFEGGIDEVAGYNYSLTPELVKEIYDATTTGKTADLSTMAIPPVAWYRMGD
jgi:hypothetical protein